MSSTLMLGGIIVLALVLHTIWGRISRARARAAQATYDDVSALGDDLVPASLHPKIDPYKCIGSGSCVNACPEHDILGMIDNRARLVNPLACVGHGACAAACPVDAITLVFGTARRGIELPVVSEQFETSQLGIYAIGELGGMGLIRNAVLQGREVGEYIFAGERRGGGDGYDAIVVGAGPAGISATLQMKKDGLRVLLLERETFGGTIRHYPRGKVAMTGPLDFPMFGQVRKRTMSKEAMVALFEQIREKTRLPLKTGELVEQVTAAPGGGWVVHATSGQYSAANVVLALGRRGSPRKLGVLGEDLPKVAYRLLEPREFHGKHVLVVGGGNAAAECALALSDDGGCASVAISYRRSEFARLRRQVRDRIEQAASAGAIRALLPTEVVSISPADVTLKRSDESMFVLPNDAVIIQIGGTPPTALLESFGIDTVTKRGER